MEEKKQSSRAVCKIVVSHPSGTLCRCAEEVRLTQLGDIKWAMRKVNCRIWQNKREHIKYTVLMKKRRHGKMYPGCLDG